MFREPGRFSSLHRSSNEKKAGDNKGQPTATDSEQLVHSDQCIAETLLVARVGSEGHLIYLNKNYLDLCQYPLSDLQENPALLFGLPSDRDRVLQEILKKGDEVSPKHRQVRLECISRDGNVYHTFHRVFPFQQEGNSRFLTLVGMETTDYWLKSYPGVSQESARALAMVKFPELNPGMVLEIDSEGVMVTSNPAAAKSLKIRDPVGTDWKLVVPEDTVEFINRLISRNELFQREVSIHNGYYLLNYRGVRELSKLFIFSSDISRQNELKEQVIHTAKLASIGELAAGVGHEINNPLAVIWGNLERLKDRLKDHLGPEELRLIDRQVASMERIKNIVSGLRDHARNDKEAVCPLDLHKVTEKSISLLEEMFRAEGIVVRRSFRAGSAWIEGNFGRLQQVLISLFSNARYAIKDNKEKIITIESISVRDQISLTVSDNGCGIPGAAREKIFDPFFTTKPVGKGTGMGLGIVATIVREHGGHIAVSSESGKGASFTLSFNTCEASDLEKSKLTDKAGKPDKFRGKVLIIDDEEGLREIVSSFLQTLGLTTDTAENGEEGLRKMEKETYQLICTDLKMPGMRGDEFLNIAREKTDAGTKFMIVTGEIAGSSAPGAGKRDLSELADLILQKPFLQADFVKAVSNLLSA